MSIHAKNFKWEKGKNDLQYIELLEKTLKNEQEILGNAVAKIRKLSEEVESIEQNAYERGYWDGQDKGSSNEAFVSYNKAIDEFVNTLNIELVYCSGYPNCGEYDYAYEVAFADARRKVQEVADKLKRGDE